jgi:hypothetical protein
VSAVVARGLAVSCLVRSRLALKTLDLTSLVGEKARAATLAFNLTQTVHGRSGQAGVTHRRPCVALGVAKGTVLTSGLTSGVHVLPRRTRVTHGKLKVVGELASGAINARRLRGCDLGLARLTKKAFILGSLVGKPARLAVGADDLTLSRSILALHALQAMTGGGAAHPETEAAIGARSLTGGVYVFSSIARNAERKRKIVRKTSSVTVRASSLAG